MDTGGAGNVENYFVCLVEHGLSHLALVNPKPFVQAFVHAPNSGRGVVATSVEGDRTLLVVTDRNRSCVEGNVVLCADTGDMRMELIAGGDGVLRGGHDGLRVCRGGSLLVMLVAYRPGVGCQETILCSDTLTILDD